MAAKRLNPRAPNYVPLSHFVVPQTPIRLIFPPYTTTTTHSAPLYDQPTLYTTLSYPIHHHHHPANFIQTLPPPSAAAPVSQQAAAVVVEQGVVPKSYRNRSGGRRCGRRERCGGGYHLREGNEKYGYVRKVLGTMKSHNNVEVLPLNRDEDMTTVMIKNIPNKYTREMLLNFLDKHCMSENERLKEAEEKSVSAFDFMYLPIDFRTGVNKGYAFVNFTHAGAVWKFHDAFNGKSWEFFESPKISEIVRAKIQGKEALVNHFVKTKFACESDEFLPVCFSPPRDGSASASGEPSTVGKRIGMDLPLLEKADNHQVN